MARFFSDVRALYERVRRPGSLRFVLEMSPLYEQVRRLDRRVAAGVVVILVGSVTLLTATLSDRSASAADGSGVVAPGEVQAGRMDLTTKVSLALQQESALARAWRERALERESARAARRFAAEYRQYRVSPTLAKEIHLAASRYELDPKIAFGLVRVESSFQRTAVSWAGAVGYTQLLPSTAQYMVPGTSRSDLFDTRTNLEIGFMYLHYLTEKYDGDVRLALTAYNRGPATVDRLLRRGHDPDNGYAGKVLQG